jgi:effector-binding domain-containing protein
MEIQLRAFGPKQYVVKKAITTSQITDKQMYDEAGKKVGGYIQQQGIVPVGPWSVLYFMWDPAAEKAEIGIGFPVAQTAAVTDPELALVDIPESKAVMGVLDGSYAGLKAAHEELVGYMAEHGLDARGLPVLALEEYVVDPSTESNPDNLVTNIYYLYN